MNCFIVRARFKDRWQTFCKNELAEFGREVAELDVSNLLDDPAPTSQKKKQCLRIVCKRLRETYDQVDANMKDLDSKTNLLVGFLGGGVGSCALFSNEPLDKPA